MAPEAPTRVAGYDLAQIANAAIVADVAAAHGLGDHGALLGIMCAMGESSLRNIDYGDWETNGVRNPDGTPTTSIGLFQQQTWWGSVPDRMDPIYASWRFFDALSKVRGWRDLEPTIAIHRVQINADPNHYAKYETPARAVLAAIPELRAKGTVMASPFDIIEVPWQPGMFGRRALVDLLEQAGRPRINSMHRVYSEQKQAWDDYRAGRGNPADNPDDPANFELGHVRGIAADIDATADNVRRLAAVGLVRPFSWESWHWRIAGNVQRWPLLYSLSTVAGGEATPIQGDDDMFTQEDRDALTALLNRSNGALPGKENGREKFARVLDAGDGDEIVRVIREQGDSTRKHIDTRVNDLAGWTRDDANSTRAALENLRVAGNDPRAIAAAVVALLPASADANAVLDAMAQRLNA